ncbi:MAG: oligosaccharide flippase family protein [Fimbriimonadales bacterium]|nr:oligosaccharide flippase family protein [Fimbriimonadales bacterium]
MPDHPPRTLRERVLVGSAYLVVVRAVSMALQLLGVTLVTRAVGPGAYGVFHASLGIASYLSSISLMKIDIFLLRETRDAPRTLFDLAFFWLLGVSLAATLIASLLIVAGQGVWGEVEQFATVAVLVCATVPLSVVRFVPQTMLERELDYRRTAFIDLTSQLMYYAVAVPAAQLGYGVWAMVGGHWAGTLVAAGGFFWAARYRPRWYWNWAQWREMVRYGMTLSVYNWLYDLRNLAPSMILLPLAGERVVGYLAIAQRFLTMLSFVPDTANRLAVPAIARIQDDAERLRRVVKESALLQTLALGIFLVGFTALAPFVLPLLLGNRWHIPTLLLAFGLAAARLQISVLFGMQGYAITVRKHLWVPLRAVLAQIALFFSLAFASTMYLPADYKLVGYLLADIVAHLVNHAIHHHYFQRLIGRAGLGISPLWTAGMLCALFAPVLSGWLYLPAAALLLNPWSLREVRSVVEMFRRRRASATAQENTT